MATDPWLSTFWHSNGAGVATLSFKMAGFSYNAVNGVVGRTMVVHDSSGNRVACGNITSTPSEVVTIKAFPGVAKSVGAVGTLIVVPTTTGVSIVGNLAGLDPSSSGTLSVNSGFSVRFFFFFFFFIHFYYPTFLKWLCCFYCVRSWIRVLLETP